jgi:hypothetical protein
MKTKLLTIAKNGVRPVRPILKESQIFKNEYQTNQKESQINILIIGGVLYPRIIKIYKLLCL